MTLQQNHPGTDLGAFIRARRRGLRLNPSTLADELKLSHAKYSEVELGITKWIGPQQAQLLCQVLDLSGDEIEQFQRMLTAAQSAPPIEFSDIFTRDDLTPVRLRTTLDTFRAPSEEQVAQLLDAVFVPLA